MLKLDHIEKYFWRGSAREIHALKNISLSIEKGEYVVIVGSNGSGKSTLLNALAGTISVEIGRAHV